MPDADDTHGGAIDLRGATDLLERLRTFGRERYTGAELERFLAAVDKGNFRVSYNVLQPEQDDEGVHVSLDHPDTKDIQWVSTPMSWGTKH